MGAFAVKYGEEISVEGDVMAPNIP